MNDRLLDSGLLYSDGDPVVIRVRFHGRHYRLDDNGAAVAKARAAGTTDRWLEIAERVAAENALDVNRRGVVFTSGIREAQIEAVAARVARSSRAVESELLAVEA